MPWPSIMLAAAAPSSSSTSHCAGWGRLYRLRQRNATVTRPQPVHRVCTLEAAAACLQRTQRWQVHQVDVDLAPGQPMRAVCIDQQQVRLQCLQRVLSAR